MNISFTWYFKPGTKNLANFNIILNHAILYRSKHDARQENAANEILAQKSGDSVVIHVKSKFRILERYFIFDAIKIKLKNSFAFALKFASTEFFIGRLRYLWQSKSNGRNELKLANNIQLKLFPLELNLKISQLTKREKTGHVNLITHQSIKLMSFNQSSNMKSNKKRRFKLPKQWSHVNFI